MKVLIAFLVVSLVGNGVLAWRLEHPGKEIFGSPAAVQSAIGLGSSVDMPQPAWQKKLQAMQQACEVQAGISQIAKEGVALLKGEK